MVNTPSRFSFLKNAQDLSVFSLHHVHIQAFPLKQRLPADLLKRSCLGVIFVDSQVTPFSKSLSPSLDLSSAAVLRVGGSTSSFVGNIFGVRVTTPDGGYIPESTCSASNALELDLGSFPLLCATNYKLYPVDNTCLEECPTDTEELTSTPVSLCMPLPLSVGSFSESKDRISAGAIVGIVLGSVAVILVVILTIRYAYKKNKLRVFLGGKTAKGKRNGQEKASPVSLPVSPTATEGPLTAEAP